MNAKYLSAQEAADYLHISLVTLWRWRKNGDLPYIKYGGRILFKKEALDQFLDANSINV